MASDCNACGDHGSRSQQTLMAVSRPETMNLSLRNFNRDDECFGSRNLERDGDAHSLEAPGEGCSQGPLRLQNIQSNHAQDSEGCSATGSAFFSS